jgi:hypothetical protein
LKPDEEWYSIVLPSVAGVVIQGRAEMAKYLHPHIVKQGFRYEMQDLNRIRAVLEGPTPAVPTHISLWVADVTHVSAPVANPRLK